jgi:hypothetical protein
MKFGPPDPSTPKWEQWFKIWCTWVVVVMSLSKACPCYSVTWQLQPMYISVAHKAAKGFLYALGNSQKNSNRLKRFSFFFWVFVGLLYKKIVSCPVHDKKLLAALCAILMWKSVKRFATQMFSTFRKHRLNQMWSPLLACSRTGAGLGLRRVLQNSQDFFSLCADGVMKNLGM